MRKDEFWPFLGSKIRCKLSKDPICEKKANCLRRQYRKTVWDTKYGRASSTQCDSMQHNGEKVIKISNFFMKNGFPNNVGRHVTDWEIIFADLTRKRKLVFKEVNLKSSRT